MKIQEIEKELKVSRANIRFYEHEGLISPARKENGYREYSNEDISQLKKIIIFRKLGLSIADIHSIFNGSLPLQTAITNNLHRLHNEINELNGAIEVCELIKETNSNEEEFPQELFWNIINTKESKGESFNEIMKDFIKNEVEHYTNIIEIFYFINLKKIKEKFGIIGVIVSLFLLLSALSFLRCLRTNEITFSAFLEHFGAYIFFAFISSVIAFPLFLFMRFLRKKYPKVSKVIDILLTILSVMCWLAILFCMVYPLFIIFKFLYEFSFG